jgi:hypothetical protein
MSKIALTGQPLFPIHIKLEFLIWHKLRLGWKARGMLANSHILRISFNLERGSDSEVAIQLFLQDFVF